MRQGLKEYKCWEVEAARSAASTNPFFLFKTLSFRARSARNLINYFVMTIPRSRLIFKRMSSSFFFF